MKVLQSEGTKLFGSKNASLLLRTENSQLCQNLTEEFSKPDCAPSKCRSSKIYRSIDGCCNNLESPTQGIIMQLNQTKNSCSWGMAHNAFLRLLPPAYSDQEGLPRGGLTSSSLPSARAVSMAVHQAHEEINQRESISQMVMQFGQGGVQYFYHLWLTLIHNYLKLYRAVSFYL